MTKKELEKEIKRLQKEIDDVTLELSNLRDKITKENEEWGIESDDILKL